jgi:hypothetical protein
MFLWFIKLALIAAAAMFTFAWYEAPATLSLQDAIVVEGQVRAVTNRRIAQFEVTTPTLNYSGRCERVSSLCEAAKSAPIPHAKVWIVESSFRDENWVAQAQVEGVTLVALATQQDLYVSHQKRLTWQAIGSTVAALAATLLLRRRTRSRGAA